MTDTDPVAAAVAALQTIPPPHNRDERRDDIEHVSRWAREHRDLFDVGLTAVEREKRKLALDEFVLAVWDRRYRNRDRHVRVQSWREARPVVARIRQVRPSDELGEKASAWWQITITGTDDGWLFQRHRTAVWMSDMLAREQLARRDWDTEEPPNA